jgi:hypothetical protein
LLGALHGGGRNVESANIPPTDFALQASAKSANGPAGAANALFSALER